MKKVFENKVVLVTGGCGTIGSEIVNQLINHNPKQIRILDQNEEQMFKIKNELKDHNNIRYLIGNIRDKERVRRAMKNVNIVFHAAALKHVPLCEYNPREAYLTNVFGTDNLVREAREEEVEKFIYISTDKAVNPINTMGATKLLGEKIVLSGRSGSTGTKFSCVRFGNVLNSSGSVIPVFKKQLKNKRSLTVTHPEMTRFFMSINQAVSLVLKSSEKTIGGDIFILKMNSIKLKDLAEVLIEEHVGNEVNAELNIIGLRPGEKMHETLITEEEAEFVKNLKDMFVLNKGFEAPHITVEGEKGDKKIDKYKSNSGKILNKEEIKKILKDEKII